MEICTDPNALKLIAIVLKVVDILKVAVLVVLIIMGMIGLAKSIFAGNPDEIKNNSQLFIKKLIAGALVFLIPTIVETGLVFFGDLAEGENFTDCIENTNNISYYEWLEEERERQKQENNNNNSSNDSSSSSNDKNIFIGTKYSLTDEQLTQLAALCERENYGAVAAEASLMANLFEYKGSKYGSGGSGLYNYVKNGGWFASGKKLGTLKLKKQKSKEEVYKVLVEGKRVLPLYINEHDCIKCGSNRYDITKIVVDGKTITAKNELLNKKNYIKNKTVIYNRYGAVYTFYEFPCSKCDPFGYTAASKKKYDQNNNN